ncbi:MAG: methylenetetrahydrofolate reductase [Nanoarchaeota archaeon]|nr:methylenetetrahydrofolate reductase [Nanoarchaeota archaeon]
MKVIDILKKGGGNIISVEIEPPNPKIHDIEHVYKILDPLIDLGIDYVNITYHAARIIEYDLNDNPVLETSKPGTMGVSGAIMMKYGEDGIEAVPHVVCTSFNKNETAVYLVDLGYLGIENVMALRGDPRKDTDGKFLTFKHEPGGHEYSSGLIKQISNLRNGIHLGGKKGIKIDFCIGASCYPEGFNGSNPTDEIPRLKEKVDAGADYLVTQMFFDNYDYFKLHEEAEKAGIHVPIVPGLFPLFKKKYLETLPEFFECKIPNDLAEQIERYNQKEDIKEAGIEWCVKQCEELYREGVPSLHFFANRGAPVKEVIEAIK